MVGVIIELINVFNGSCVCVMIISVFLFGFGGSGD